MKWEFTWREKTMFNKKSSFLVAAVILAAFFGASAANAQDTTCPYTLASLQGSYSVIGHYANDVALALAMDTMDGNGNFTRKATVNQPVVGSATGNRTLTSTISTGTYTVNCDGTGVITRALTNLTTGVVTTTVADFVITETTRLYTGSAFTLVATSLVDAQRTPSAIVPGGIFVYFVHTRLLN